MKRIKASKKCSHQRRLVRNDCSLVKPSGAVVLPVDFDMFRLGQRVYFCMGEAEVTIVAKPKRSVGGRFLSCRIKKGLRSLASYGPRVRKAQ